MESKDRFPHFHRCEYDYALKQKGIIIDREREKYLTMISWRGLAAGTDPMQRRVLHLMRRLNMEPARVPASNLVFVRSARGIGIKSRLPELARSCWPFHLKVIGELGIATVLCF